jgi:hypothetical protein
LVALSCFITVFSLWGHVVAVSTQLTGLATKTLGLQGHYTFTGFRNNANTMSITDVSGQVAVLHGSFDLHAQRTDWNVVLFEDTFGLFLSPNPSGRFYLWAKRFNATTHVLEHTTGSPWALQSVRVGSTTGNDLPVFIRQPPDEPLFYFFVIQSSQTTWSVPLYTAAS